MTTSGEQPKAVIFDLFNTLVPGGSSAERDDVSRRMAHTLGVDPQRASELVRSSFDARTRGHLADLDTTVRWLAHQLGGRPSDQAVSTAVKLRLAMTGNLLARSWALNALAALKNTGLILGVVSDCSAETPTLWPTSELAPFFSATSFSCITGRRKPESEAYLVAVRRLGVDPNECLFVGDGGSHELSGAEAIGMRAYRFSVRNPALSPPIDEDVGWRGPIVRDLGEVVYLLGEGQGGVGRRTPADQFWTGHQRGSSRVTESHVRHGARPSTQCAQQAETGWEKWRAK